MRGELDAFPVAWEALPKDRIHHCHCKNAIKGAQGKVEWAPVDKGFIDWTAQFRALKQAGYHDAVSLETHWHAAATPEASTRISWAGMKHAPKTPVLCRSKTVPINIERGQINSNWSSQIGGEDGNSTGIS